MRSTEELNRYSWIIFCIPCALCRRRSCATSDTTKSDSEVESGAALRLSRRQLECHSRHEFHGNIDLRISFFDWMASDGRLLPGLPYVYTHYHCIFILVCCVKPSNDRLMSCDAPEGGNKCHKRSTKNLLWKAILFGRFSFVANLSWWSHQMENKIHV